MVELMTFQTIFQFLQTVGILVGVFYYIMTLRNNRRNQELQLETRQAQLFINIFNTFSSKQYQKDRERMLRSWEFESFEDFFSKYGPEVNPEDHAIFDMFISHFEGIAVLVQRRLIEPKLVYDLMYGSIIAFWEKFEPVFMGLREMSESPKTLQDLESLYHEMKRLAAEDGAKGASSYTTPFRSLIEQ
jgi:hypothetical protein